MDDQNAIDQRKMRKKASNRLSYERNRANRIEKARLNRKEKKRTLERAELFCRIWPTILLSFKQFKTQVLNGFKFTLNPNVFLFLLVVATTYYLLAETVTYSSDIDSDIRQAWLKALVGEGMIISLSWLNFGSWRLNVLRTVTLVILGAYSVASVSGKLVVLSQQRFTSFSVNQTLIHDLEKDMLRKEQMQKELQQQKWISAARHNEKQMDLVRNELVKLRLESSTLHEPVQIIFTLLIQIVFRISVLIGNMMLVHALSESYRTSRRNGPTGIKSRLAFSRS